MDSYWLCLNSHLFCSQRALCQGSSLASTIWTTLSSLSSLSTARLGTVSYNTQLQSTGVLYSVVLCWCRFLGWDSLLECVTREWSTDIMSRQLPLILKGVGPTHYITQFGEKQVYISATSLPLTLSLSLPQFMGWWIWFDFPTTSTRKMVGLCGVCSRELLPSPPQLVWL